MKTILLRLCALIALLTSASAEIIGVDTFDYSDGTIAGKNGGAFWDFKNIAPAGHDGTPSNWDNVLGAPTVTASRLSTNNSSAKREFNGPSNGFGSNPASDEENGSFTDGRVNQVLYLRTTFTTPATLPNVIGLSTYDFGTEVIFFGKPFNKPNFGIAFNNGFGPTDSMVQVLPNTTYTLVAKIDYPADKVSLYVNPDLNAVETSATPVVTLTGYNVNTFSTAARLASSSGSSVTWDNLVVATTWEELGIVGVTVVTTTADEDDGPNSLNTPADISLREAVKYSPSGTLITFDPVLNGATCTLSTFNDIVVTKNLTLDASSLSAGLTIDGGSGANRIFYVNSGQSLALRGLSLTGGNGAGASFSGFGGAILNDGTLTLTQCTLSGNSAGGGGAILNGGTLTLTQCTLSGNSASGGGAINNNGTLTLTQSTLSGNVAEREGGAINNENGTQTLTLTQCTLSGNSANNGGAINHGVASLNNGLLTLAQCTFSGNSATNNGGAIRNNGSLTLMQCIVAGNSVFSGNGPDIFFAGGSITSFDDNLIGQNTTVSGNFPPGSLVGTAAAPLNPKLSPLGYFGGPTQTMHPLIGSPAIDAAGTTNPRGTDQRGFPGFVDGDANGTAQLDIGAVETGPLRIVAFSSDSGSSGGLRGRISQSTEPGARIGFFTSNFPSQSITLNGTELSIPGTANGLFIDASNLSGPVTVSGNNASRVFNIASGATLAMHNLVITGGRSPDGTSGSGGDGGGILNNGRLSLHFSTVTNNRTGSGNGGGGDGGGIFSVGPMDIAHSTIANNLTGNGGSSGIFGSSGGNGGGIFSTARLDIVRSTIANNLTGNGGTGTLRGSGGSGGGIFFSTELDITHSTIASNRTGSGGFAGAGGGITAAGSTTPLALRYSIVAQNTGNFGSDLFKGNVTYQGANFIGDPTGTDSTTGTPTLTGDPLLAPLADNGGPTQTMALRVGSPAINAATSSTATSDQRGFPIVGVADLGAFEYQPASLVGVLVASGDLNFGQVTVGSSATRTINLANTGTAVINVSGLSLPTGFSGNFTGTVAFNTIQQVNITFTPTSAVAFSGTLTVNSDAASGTSTLPISGSGFVPPAPVTFFIKIKANSSKKGTVTGGGNLVVNTTATLKAKAKKGRKFLKWTEGKKTVSKKATYRFVVTKNRSLVANFQ